MSIRFEYDSIDNSKQKNDEVKKKVIRMPSVSAESMATSSDGGLFNGAHPVGASARITPLTPVEEPEGLAVPVCFISNSKKRLVKF